MTALWPTITLPQTQNANATGNGCAVNVLGHARVEVTCQGIPPPAIRVLEKQFELRLKERDVRLEKLQEEANDWRDKYVLLVRRLAQPSIDRATRDKAQLLVNEGKFEKAGYLLDQIIDDKEHEVGELAQAYFDRASLYELQFQARNAQVAGACHDAQQPGNTLPQYAAV